MSAEPKTFATREAFAENIATEFLGKSRAPRLQKRIEAALFAAEMVGAQKMRRAAMREVQMHSGFSNAINGTLRKVAEAVGKLPLEMPQESRP